MHSDEVTGIGIELEIVVPVHPGPFWELITDVPRIGEWSPECTQARWLDSERTARVGTRFAGLNRFAGGGVGEVECVVVRHDPLRHFTWAVLGRDADPSRPGSIWHYDLEPRTGGLLVRHGFRHGPGETGLRAAIRQDPDAGPAVLGHRLRDLRRHMSSTLTAMTAHLTMAPGGVSR